MKLKKRIRLFHVYITKIHGKVSLKMEDPFHPNANYGRRLARESVGSWYQLRFYPFPTDHLKESKKYSWMKIKALHLLAGEEATFIHTNWWLRTESAWKDHVTAINGVNKCSYHVTWLFRLFGLDNFRVFIILWRV